jgi:glycosyltransferase involved in cell wall biosynthesis
MFPKARQLVYCEFFYGAEGRDIGFDPEFPISGLDGHIGLQLKNATTLLALADCDVGISPTNWQQSTFPRHYQSKIEVIHEGIDTSRVRPDPQARLMLPNGRQVGRSDEIVTFVVRNLEPLRGYHIFMRALLQQRGFFHRLSLFLNLSRLLPYRLHLGAELTIPRLIVAELTLGRPRQRRGSGFRSSVTQ